MSDSFTNEPKKSPSGQSNKPLKRQTPEEIDRFLRKWGEGLSPVSEKSEPKK